MVLTCAYCLGIILRLFFFTKCTKSFLRPKLIDTRYLVYSSPPTIQFYADSFETLQMFRSWSEDVHIVLV